MSQWQVSCALNWPARVKVAGVIGSAELADHARRVGTEVGCSPLLDRHGVFAWRAYRLSRNSTTNGSEVSSRDSSLQLAKTALIRYRFQRILMTVGSRTARAPDARDAVPLRSRCEDAGRPLVQPVPVARRGHPRTLGAARQRAQHRYGTAALRMMGQLSRLDPHCSH